MSQLVLDIKNDTVKEKIVWLLQHFTKNELEIVEENVVLENDKTWTNEYIEKNWKRIVSKSLANLPEDYEKSDAYHEDGAINAIQNNWKSIRDVQLTSGHETQNPKEQLANALLQRYYEKKKREIVIEIPIELKRKFREDNNLTFLNINEALEGI